MLNLPFSLPPTQIRRGLPRNLHWPVVARLCDTLPSLEWLQVLDLGAWSCKQFGLLSDHNQCEGWMLSLLPNLTRISVCNVGAKFFQVRILKFHCVIAYRVILIYTPTSNQNPDMNKRF